MKISAIFLNIIIIFLFISCHSENPTEINGDFKIISLVKDSLAIGDTLVINGEFLGSPTNKKVIKFDSTISVGSKECILWTNNLITLVVPENTKSGYIKFYDDKKLLDSIYLGISPIPFFKIIEVPAGKFKRGSENSSIDEYPVKEISITKPFLISVYEVSQRLYEAVNNENPSIPINNTLPVVNVKWIDAVKFCNNLSIIQGLKPYYIITGVDVSIIDSADGWRLPTEAEWEYACRAGTKGDYSGTNNIDDMGWYSDNSGLKLHPSGKKSANDFALYDMHGNCWEWCWDFYDKDYYKSNDTINPIGPTSGDRRVLRGGSWNDGKNFARSANRTIPLNFTNNIGFRIVRNKK